MILSFHLGPQLAGLVGVTVFFWVAGLNSVGGLSHLKQQNTTSTGFIDGMSEISDLFAVALSVPMIADH